MAAIVGQFADGATTEEVLAAYPDIEAEDIRQALAYAAWLTREDVVPVTRHRMTPNEAVAAIREARKGRRLDGITIRELIEEGRR